MRTVVEVPSEPAERGAGQAVPVVPQQQRKLGPAAPALRVRAAAGRRCARGPVHACLLLQLALLLRGPRLSGACAQQKRDAFCSAQGPTRASGQGQLPDRV